MVVCKFDRAIGVCAVFICKKAQMHCHAWIGIIGAFFRRWRTVTIYAATVLFIAWAIYLLASLLYLHLLDAHARRSQNRAPHSGRVALFKRRGARTARGMGEVRFCKAGVIKVWMMGRCFVWNFLGVPNFFSEGGREIFL